MLHCSNSGSIVASPSRYSAPGVRLLRGARQPLEQPRARQRVGLQRVRARARRRHAHQHLRHPAVQRVAPEQHDRLLDRIELALGQRAGAVQVLQQPHAQRGVGLDRVDHGGVVLVVEQPVQQLQRALRLRRQRLRAPRLDAAADAAGGPQHGRVERGVQRVDRWQVEQQQRYARPALHGRLDRLLPGGGAGFGRRRQRHEVGPAGARRHRRRGLRGPAHTHSGAAQSGHQQTHRRPVAEQRIGAQQQVHAGREVRIERGRREPARRQRGQRAQALAAAQPHRAQQVDRAGDRRGGRAGAAAARHQSETRRPPACPGPTPAGAALRCRCTARPSVRLPVARCRPARSGRRALRPVCGESGRAGH
jgi:hypothetical protein